MKNKDNYIIISTLTLEKAQLLQAILSDKGIASVFEFQQGIQTLFSPDVTVSIKKEYLPQLIQLLKERPGYEQSFQINVDELQSSNTILVPIDFSDYSMRACRFAFDLASHIKSSVKLLHAFFTPYMPSSYPDTDNFSMEINEEMVSQELNKRVHEQAKDFSQNLTRQILAGKLPDVNFEFVIVEGIPEEEINHWARENNPIMIVMGTRGKDQKEQDLIGSVTAEVIDTSKVPVFAIPEDTQAVTIHDVKRLAFVTNFDQRDLLGFDKLMHLKGFKDKQISFIYLMNKKSDFDFCRMEYISNYLVEKYPDLKATFGKMDETELLRNTDDFIRDDRIDVLVLTTHKRNIFARLFNPSIAHKMVFHSDTPLLIIRN